MLASKILSTERPFLQDLAYQIYLISLSQQFGFKAKYNTIQAAMEFTENFQLTQEGSFSSFRVGHAFDTVKGDLLLCELECFGVRGLCLKLMRSYHCVFNE